MASQHPGRDDATAQQDAPLPRRYGAYTLLQRLSRHGARESYVASTASPASGELRWLLILHPPPKPTRDFDKRFRKRCETWANLDHPNLTRLLDFGDEAGTYFVCTEYVSGAGLDEVLDASSSCAKDLPVGFVFEVLGSLLESAAFAHERGVGHGSITPESVRCSWEGEVKLRAPDFWPLDLNKPQRVDEGRALTAAPRADLACIGNLADLLRARGVEPPTSSGPPWTGGIVAPEERRLIEAPEQLCRSFSELARHADPLAPGGSRAVYEQLLAVGARCGLTRDRAHVALLLADVSSALPRDPLLARIEAAWHRPTGASPLTLFSNEIPWGRTWIHALEEEGFAPIEFRRVPGDGSPDRTWLVHTRPAASHRRALGLAEEVLFVVSRDAVGIGDLTHVHDEVVRSGLRLDGSVIVVTDGRPDDLRRRLSNLPGYGQRVAWPVRAGATIPLLEALRAQLREVDVFDERDPVRGAQLLERRGEFDALARHVTGGDAVVIAGIRKVGKTSLARAVTDWLDPASGLRRASRDAPASRGVAVWVDAQAIVDETADGVADEILRALRRRMRMAGSPAQEGSRASGMEGLKTSLEALLDRGELLCVVIDEFDLLFERVGGATPVPGISRLFRLLRALSQRHPGRFSLVLIGRDPRLLDAPMLEGVTNPLLLWCHTFWLGPMRPPHDGNLLRHLGRRVGLAVGPRSVEQARAWTGGHPLLLRQWGSVLWSVAQKRRSRWGASTDALLEGVEGDFRGRDTVMTVAREVIDLLQTREPSSFALLEELAMAAAPGEVIARAGGLSAPACQTLIRYGILAQDPLALPRFLTDWLCRMAPARAAPPSQRHGRPHA